MRNRYIVDVLTSVDTQKIVKNGGKVIEIYEGVVYRESFKLYPFKTIIDKLFELRQNYKNENNVVLHLLVNLIMNSLYGEHIRKDIEESKETKADHLMLTEYDERVLDYQKFIYFNYLVKLKDDFRLKDEGKKINTIPFQLGAFLLSNSKQIMNTFIDAIDDFYTNGLYYEYTDGMYVENKHWEKLDKAGLVGKNLIQVKNGHKDGGIWYGLFLAPKKNIV